MKRSPPESDWPQAGVCCPCCVCFNLKTRFAFPMAPPKSGFSFHLHSPMKEEVRPPSSPPFGANQTSVKFIPVLLLVPQTVHVDLQFMLKTRPSRLPGRTCSCQGLPCLSVAVLHHQPTLVLALFPPSHKLCFQQPHFSPQRRVTTRFLACPPKDCYYLPSHVSAFRTKRL